MRLASPCKINLLLNVLGKRADGFHELETVMQSLPLADELELQLEPEGIHLTCDSPSLSAGPENLVFQAATSFLSYAEIQEGARIHLQKKIPLEAGLGGGSSNAATTLLGLNQLHGNPLSREALHNIAASIGSDIPFFLEAGPAMATGRGEHIMRLPAFPALQNRGLLLIHPGFGIATPWAYRELSKYPETLNGKPGLAERLIHQLQDPDLAAAGALLFNSLEKPALKKYPLLAMFQSFLKSNGSKAVLMSGSGTATFAITSSLQAAEVLGDLFKKEFGKTHWTAVMGL